VKPTQPLWAALADERLRATPEQLCDALGACTELNVVYRRLLKMALEELRLIDEQIGELDKEMASLLSEHQDAVQRLAEVPGLGVDSAQQIIAEVGATAETFPSEKCLSSWVGCLPGRRRDRRRKLQPTALQRVTATCGGYSIRLLTPQPEPKEVFSRSCIVARSRAWDTIKPSGHRPSTVSTHLADPAPGSPLRRTGPSGHQTIEATPHLEDASATPKPRLSDRSTESSTQQAQAQ